MQLLQKQVVGLLPGTRDAEGGPARALLGTLTILGWVITSHMTSTTGTTAGLGTFNRCTHKHTPSHGLSDAWERPKSSQSTVRPSGRQHHLWCTTRNQDMATEGGMGNTSFLPSEKSMLTLKLFLLPGMTVACNFQLKRFYRWQIPVSKPYGMSCGYSGPFRRKG